MVKDERNAPLFVIIDHSIEYFKNYWCAPTWNQQHDRSNDVDSDDFVLVFRVISLEQIIRPLMVFIIYHKIRQSFRQFQRVVSAIFHA